MGRVAPALENLSPDLVRRGGTDRRRVSLCGRGGEHVRTCGVTSWTRSACAVKTDQGESYLRDSVMPESTRYYRVLELHKGKK